MSVKPASSNFIRDIVADDLISGRHSSVVTRFPPEPNGYLHLGHAKSIVLNFGLAQEFGGYCYLRLDDTNPAKEEAHFDDAIRRDVEWLGYDWGQHLRYASDYFDQLYEWATYLIRSGNAYVDDQSQEEIRSTRGTLTGAWTGQPLPRADRRREHGSLLEDACRRVSGGQPGSSGKDRHVVGKHQFAGSGPVPNSP